MELYQSKIDSLMLTGDADIDNKQIASLAIDLYNEYIVSKNTKIMVFGHRYHNADPRADKLMELVIKKKDVLAPILNWHWPLKICFIKRKTFV